MATLETYTRLPEHTNYHDTGCHLFPSCLNCPQDTCIFDVAPDGGAAQRNERDRAMARLAQGGLSAVAVAMQFSLSPSQVRRRLRHLG